MRAPLIVNVSDIDFVANQEDRRALVDVIRRTRGGHQPLEPQLMAAEKITAGQVAVRARKGGEKIVVLTAYDVTFARLVDERGRGRRAGRRQPGHGLPGRRTPPCRSRSTR